MRQFHVRAHYRHCKGQRTVSPDESVITFISEYYVNGLFIDSGWAELEFAPFGELWLTLPGPEEAERRGVNDFVEFYEALTPEDCLEGSDFNFAPGVIRAATRGIPVSTLEFSVRRY